MCVGGEKERCTTTIYTGGAAAAVELRDELADPPALLQAPAPFLASSAPRRSGVVSVYALLTSLRYWIGAWSGVLYNSPSFFFPSSFADRPLLYMMELNPTAVGSSFQWMSIARC